MKIGILTFHYSNNYGALLQTYALSKVLIQLGFEPMIINRIPKQNIGCKTVKSTLRQLVNKHFLKSFTQFRIDHLENITRPLLRECDLKEVVETFDAVIVGSDQVWRMEYTTGLELNNFLDFVPDHISKISYAASFGIDQFNCDKETLIKVRNLLARFKAISVRESSGVSICKNLFNVNATHLLDPTLILFPEDYNILMAKSGVDLEKTVIRYLMDETIFKVNLVNLIAETKKLKILNITRECETGFSIKGLCFNWNKYYYPSFSKWLEAIRDAEFVVTDSYHGLAFSILFNKQFICIANKERGVSRMMSLLEKLKLVDRLIFEHDNLSSFKSLPEINYEPINKILDLERSKSLEFLKSV